MVLQAIYSGINVVIIKNWSNRAPFKGIAKRTLKNCNNKRMKGYSGIGSQNLQNLLW